MKIAGLNINRWTIRYMARHWKLGAHLLFRTYHFGVNNQWWYDSWSFMGWPNWKKIWSIITIMPMIKNWRGMKFRMGVIGFVSHKTYIRLFGTEGLAYTTEEGLTWASKKDWKEDIQ